MVSNGRLAAVNRGCFGGCHSWCYQNGEAPSIGGNQMYKTHVYIYTVIHSYNIGIHIILDHFRLGGRLKMTIGFLFCQEFPSIQFTIDRTIYV